MKVISKNIFKKEDCLDTNLNEIILSVLKVESI